MTKTIKEFLSEKYLDICEKLPRINKTAISKIQMVRERQRRDAEILYNETRLPEEFKYNLLAFRLFDVFFIENLDKVKDSFINTFPDLTKVRS